MFAVPKPPVIVWFRQDLRLADNPALGHAAQSGRPVVPVYILDDHTPGPWAPGGASRWWLHHSLAALSGALAGLGCPLILRRGRADVALRALVRETGAEAVVWNRCYEPHAIARDSTLKADLKAEGIAVDSFNAALLAEPWTVKTGTGGPYKVFTPFWKAVREGLDPGRPEPAPRHLATLPTPPDSDRLADWGLLPTRPDWAGGLRDSWTPGEAGARQRLEDFLARAVARYPEGRDYPAQPLTSRLSPHLHFGEISPRQIWAAAQAQAKTQGSDGVDSFLRELGWREFCHHLLYHFPFLSERPLNPKFEAFAWDDNAGHLAAWQRGLTGYPIVDAGMRELWATGWMHNRVRMVVGSFLVKHLLLPWTAGQAWFWDTLVDADLANNTASWQWIAGCGADAAPYFRVFNPVLQGEKFDAKGDYVRRWVPELAGLPDRVLHQPWTADPITLRTAGVRLGHDYPHPVVEHKAARQRALDTFAAIRDDND
ncbi:cryptochrome/photolyase family protein [Nitrospirillum viridazoti]|uniref:Deoxyribodipyrimidine photo-lyase n=1 Tax=Nitrospirillum viridazoti CBAmc TaxID=1441467 RepID=A0A248JMV3_9PROT|nr:deoxyribodipyrimidine photo-lyase [Nitrospirillum amazonense]ASG20073.1 deoxyribodipyrimidine photolyase [Nitrospirillum amazonense CBAmc]TWB36228.1 deoxyribodipyrimidine photo-lyase [Nitrospirillum amazonense]